MFAKDRFVSQLAGFLLLPWVVACGLTDDDEDDDVLLGTLEQRRDFRAIAGISMGGYGAMNLGLKHPELFRVIGSLGGPVDLRELLRHIVEENLEVKLQEDLPAAVGDDFTFDHLPPYPDRETRIEMMQDLVLAFGHPLLHHPDPDRAYLAADSQAATMGVDDQWGTFSIPSQPGGFRDGGDGNEDGLRQSGEPADFDTEVLLVARDTLSLLDPTLAGTVIGGRELADQNGDGIFDVGDGLVINLTEPFDDANGNFTWDPGLGESFEDHGLDGVPGTLDFGEGNGVFDEDPDLAAWWQQDPLTRIQDSTTAELAQQRIYMDVGTLDEFAFESHYLNVVEALQGKGLPVTVRDLFPGDCADLPTLESQRLLVRYVGGHIGIPDADDITDSLRDGDFCEPLVVWDRLRTLLAFLESQFPDGVDGPRGLRLIGEVVTRDVPSPALTLAGDAEVQRRVVVYRPPAFFNTDRQLPIVYFLGGYGQEAEDYERMGLLLDLLIITGELQNLFFAFVPGEGGKKGSFYVDHRVSHDQAPETDSTTGAYETSLLEDLMPVIENEILRGRVRR